MRCWAQTLNLKKVDLLAADPARVERLLLAEWSGSASPYQPNWLHTSSGRLNLCNINTFLQEVCFAVLLWISTSIQTGKRCYPYCVLVYNAISNILGGSLSSLPPPTGGDWLSHLRGSTSMCVAIGEVLKSSWMVGRINGLRSWLNDWFHEQILF